MPFCVVSQMDLHHASSSGVAQCLAVATGGPAGPSDAHHKSPNPSRVARRHGGAADGDGGGVFRHVRRKVIPILDPRPHPPASRKRLLQRLPDATESTIPRLFHRQPRRPMPPQPHWCEDRQQHHVPHQSSSATDECRQVSTQSIRVPRKPEWRKLAGHQTGDRKTTELCTRVVQMCDKYI